MSFPGSITSASISLIPIKEVCLTCVKSVEERDELADDLFGLVGCLGCRLVDFDQGLMRQSDIDHGLLVLLDHADVLLAFGVPIEYNVLMRLFSVS